MAQNPFDQLSKQYLEEFLAPIGTVQRQYEIPGEAKFVDVWFVPKADWIPRVYFLSGIFKSAIVALDELPETQETLWLRLLGRDATQERAIREVLALPPDHPRRNTILRLLSNWKIRIDLGELANFSGQEAIMAFSEAFLEWERQTQEKSKQEGRQKGRQEAMQRVALRLIQQGLPIETIAQATELSIAEIQILQSQQQN